mmetsp:Transcript_28893/g.48498  ORF Transcript_28893/g.48498 Transcript_28893/m.48498 type:complete len:544 (-) Transcript_28893:13-1644(-)
MSYQKDKDEGVALLDSRKAADNYESVTKKEVDSSPEILSPHEHQRLKVLGPHIFLEPATVKSAPKNAPYSRMAKNRSYSLYWINQFRHWWKWCRLVVRLAALYAYTQDATNWNRIITADLLRKKGPKITLKLIRRLSQGGPIRPFLKNVQPFTRCVRILVAVWRTIEAARCRRREVRLAELLAFFCNRCARALARDAVDIFSEFILLPVIFFLIDRQLVDHLHWHQAWVIIIMGIVRAVAPFMASFQGSRFGRFLTKSFFDASNDRWMPTMRINDVNMTTGDCVEYEEAGTAKFNADLVLLAKKFAGELSKDLESGENAPHHSSPHLEAAHFHIFGRGSGGYCVYRYQPPGISKTFSLYGVLIHVTPYGPSIYDELPRYVVLEHRDVMDTRGTWSHLAAQYLYDEPEILEGYCFKGAYFTKYHFASMRDKYDEVMQAYTQSCKYLCSRDGMKSHQKQEVPPTDLLSLKTFIEYGKPMKKQRKHIRAYKELQHVVDHLAHTIQHKMAAASSSSSYSSSQCPCFLFHLIQQICHHHRHIHSALTG